MTVNSDTNTHIFNCMYACPAAVDTDIQQQHWRMGGDTSSTCGYTVAVRVGVGVQALADTSASAAV